MDWRAGSYVIFIKLFSRKKHAVILSLFSDFEREDVRHFDITQDTLLTEAIVHRCSIGKHSKKFLKFIEKHLRSSPFFSKVAGLDLEFY